MVMRRQLNSDSGQLVRGLVLGEAMARGETLTSARIRELTGVSRATARRDMLVVETTLRPDVEIVTGQVRLTKRK